MEQQSKFISNNIYPVLLSIINKKKAVLICMIYQELNEMRMYTETMIEFLNITPLKPGSKINLIGSDISNVMKDKTELNTIITTFNSYPDIVDSYFYLCKGTTGADKLIDILIPRQEFVRVKYTIDTIAINGGFPKSSAYIYKYKQINFIKIEKVQLEGSKVIQYKYNGDSKISVIKNAFRLTCGPKKYSVVETIGIAKEIEDKDLRIPTPSYVFDKVYKDVDEVNRLILDDGELILVQFNTQSYKDNITVYTIKDIANIEILSSKYLIKEN